MTLRGLRLDYLVALALAALALVPGFHCVRSVSRDKLAPIERARRFRPPVEGRREVHFLGTARATPGAPVQPADRPPSGRPCLAWTYDVATPRVAPAKGSDSRCSLQGQQPFLLKTPEHLFFSPLPGALRPRVNRLQSDQPGPVAGCPVEIRLDPKDAKRRDFSYEYCLLPGDVVEVWGCREGDRLVPCGDGQDAMDAPPRGPNTDRMAEDASYDLCGCSILMLPAMLLAIVLLFDRLQMTRDARRRSL